MKQLHYGTRVDAAEALLAGNDTGCFTTEQYRQAFLRRIYRNAGPEEMARVARFKDETQPGWGRRYLEWLRDAVRMVREVRPDVWSYPDAR
jgi:hypothetical protein